MGFWFYQKKVEAVGPDASGLGSFTKSHTARSATGHGDILVVADFLTGGKAPTVSVYEWVDSGGSASTHLDLIAGGTTDPADCTQGAAPKQNATPVPPVGNNDNYCATTNSFVVTSPWAFTPKPNSGGTAGAGGTAQFGISEFMEGGINLTALGLGIPGPLGGVPSFVPARSARATLAGRAARIEPCDHHGDEGRKAMQFRFSVGSHHQRLARCQVLDGDRAMLRVGGNDRRRDIVKRPRNHFFGAKACAIRAFVPQGTRLVAHMNLVKCARPGVAESYGVGSVAKR